jgi:hypothetical protein
MKRQAIGKTQPASRMFGRLRIGLATAAAAGLVGCVQMPTETQGAVDMRPRIGFSVASGVDTTGARVLVDGLDAGALADFRPPAGRLVVLAGNHEVRVVQGQRVLLNERVFLADGAQRDLIVSPGTLP